MSSRERNMLIGLGVVAVAALAFFLLTSGDGGPEETTAPTSITSSPGSAPSQLPVEEEGQEQEEPKEQAPDEALDFLGGRDPFVPLVQETTSGSETPTDTTTGDTTGGTATDDTTTGDTTTGDTTTGDTTTGETGETATGGSSSGSSGSSVEDADVAFTGRPVTLVSISSRESGNVARVKVGGKTFTVREGHRFSRSFEILSVRRHCARLLLGDRAFTLCEE